MTDIEKVEKLAECANEKIDELETFTKDMSEVLENMQKAVDGLKGCFLPPIANNR